MRIEISRWRRWTMTALALTALAVAAPSSALAAPERPLQKAERAAIMAALARAPAEGLPPIAVSPGASDEVLQRAAIAYAGALRGQRLNGDRSPDWALRPAWFDPAPAFHEALARRDLDRWLAALAPRGAAYQSLRQALARYRALAARGGWPALRREPLRPGARGPQVLALRARLAIENGPGPLPVDPMAFDYLLVQRLRGEQARLGLPVTGALDRATIVALNVPVEDRIATLEANMERERWLPPHLPDFRLEVNIADQRLEAIENERPLLAMKTIVGRPDTPTPMLSDVIMGAVFNPPWNVPTKVAQTQILPHARRDRGYLARHGYVVLDSGMLQQRPGPNSGLGKIKFEMTNPLAVYLHDTPGRDLFEHDERAFSNGCIRLEKARELMWLLFDKAGGWDGRALNAALTSSNTVLAQTAAPMPVFVVYRTAFVRDGQVNFRRDLYGWDARLTALLDARP